MRDNRLIIIDNFASKEDCKKLEEAFAQEQTKPYKFSYEDVANLKLGPGPAAKMKKYEDQGFHPDISGDFLSIAKAENPIWTPWVEKIRGEMFKTYQPGFKNPLEYERASSVRSHPNTGFYMHWDKTQLDDQLYQDAVARGIPHEVAKEKIFANRTANFTGILYLNDAGGGEIIIEDLGKIEPKPGRLILFESSHFYHGINYIDDYRHTLIVWIEQVVEEDFNFNIRQWIEETAKEYNG